jgi:hypothetical protein
MNTEQAPVVSDGNLKQKFKFTRKQIVFVLILLAAIGIAFLIRSFAAESTVTLKAYTMTYQVGNVTKPGKITDSGAVDKTALGMYSAGTASQSVALPNVTRIDVRARADICKGTSSDSGNPTMILKIDSKEVARWDVGSKTWATYSKTVTAAPGNHNIQVVFPNDYSYYPKKGTSCDRNLFLDTINFVGTTPDTSPSTQVPVLRVTGQTISWDAIPGVANYVLATTVGTDRTKTQYSKVTGTMLTPPAVPGQTVYYGLRADVTDAPWAAKEVAISYPETTPTTPQPTTPTGNGDMIVGIDIGNFNTAGANDVKGTVGYARIEQGVVAPSIYKNVGMKVIVNFSGPYNTGGVSAINATSWANDKLSWYKTNCGDANTCPVIEVLNEPGGTWFWGANAISQANANAYANLVKTTYNTFKTAFGANAPKVLATYDGSSGTTFGDRWWAADTDHSYVDGLIVHPYGLTVNRTESAKGNQSLVTSVRTKTNKPIYVTEVGWPTATSQPSTGDSFQWTEAEQASNTHNFISWARSTGYVNAVVLFNYRDYGTANWYGITRPDGTHKPAFDALRCAAQSKPIGCQ